MNSFKLRDYQEKAIEELKQNYSDNKTSCVVSPTGCHQKGTPILLNNGRYKNVEDIKIGEKLLGTDGERTVTAIHRGIDAMFKVIPVKGKPFIVNGGHILSLVRTNDGKSDHGGEITNVSVYDYLYWSKYKKHIHKLYYSDEVAFTESIKLNFDPYVLGALIGDGSFAHNLRFTSKDKEVYQIVNDYLSNHNVPIHKNVGSGCFEFNYGQAKENWLRSSLENLNLYGRTSGDKFIPEEYKYASIDERLQLLAGLIDTNGSNSSNVFDYTTKSKHLADDVAFIARSVGLRVSVTKKIATIKTLEFSGEYYRLCISGNIEKIPCRTYKKATPRQQKKNPLRTGFKIKYVGQGEYYGFEVDKDHLYLFNDFLVTHNSGKTPMIVEFVRWLNEIYPDAKICVSVHRLEILNNLKENLEGCTCDFQTIQYLNKHSECQYDVLIIDECHHVVAQSYRNVIKNNTKWHCGFTATPLRGYMPDVPDFIEVYRDTWKTELTGLANDKLFQKFVLTVDTAELIKRGYLSKYEIKNDIDFHIKHTGSKNQDYTKSEVDAVITPDEAAAYIETTLEKKKGIVFCHSIEFAETLTRLLGDKAVCITSKTKRSQRDKWFDDFKNGDIKLLVNVDIFSEGVDVPAVDCVYLFRPTRSIPVYFQQIGRALRLAKGKTKAIVYDYVNNKKRLGVEPIDISLDEMLLEAHFSKESCEICGAYGVIQSERDKLTGSVPTDEIRAKTRWLTNHKGQYQYSEISRHTYTVIPEKGITFVGTDLLEYIELFYKQTFKMYRLPIIMNPYRRYEVANARNIGTAIERKTGDCIELTGVCKYSDTPHPYYVVVDNLVPHDTKRNAKIKF